MLSRADSAFGLRVRRGLGLLADRGHGDRGRARRGHRGAARPARLEDRLSHVAPADAGGRVAGSARSSALVPYLRATPEPRAAGVRAARHRPGHEGSSGTRPARGSNGLRVDVHRHLDALLGVSAHEGGTRRRVSASRHAAGPGARRGAARAARGEMVTTHRPSSQWPSTGSTGKPVVHGAARTTLARMTSGRPGTGSSREDHGPSPRCP